MQQTNLLIVIIIHFEGCIKIVYKTKTKNPLWLET